MDAIGLLKTRRSIRYFEEKEISLDILNKVFELTRYAPSAKNSQPSYLVIVKDKEKRDKLGAIRGKSSAPIARAPLAVAICADPSISTRYIQDGCIFAYHFMLSAWAYGLGTCWIADMDRDEVKEILGIPKDHYVATVTPLGYPGEAPPIKDRKRIEEFIKEI